MALTLTEAASYLNPAFEAAYPEIAAFCIYEPKPGTFLVEVWPVNGKGFGTQISASQSPKELILMQIGIIHEVFQITQA